MVISLHINLLVFYANFVVLNAMILKQESKIIYLLRKLRYFNFINPEKIFMR